MNQVEKPPRTLIPTFVFYLFRSDVKQMLNSHTFFSRVLCWSWRALGVACRHWIFEYLNILNIWLFEYLNIWWWLWLAAHWSRPDCIVIVCWPTLPSSFDQNADRDLMIWWSRFDDLMIMIWWFDDHDLMIWISCW